MANSPFNVNEIVQATGQYTAGSIPYATLVTLLDGSGNPANSQASFGSQQDNLALTSTAYFQRWTASAPVSVTGIVAPSVDGFSMLIVNIGASAITLKNLVTSTAANQFQNSTNADIVLNQFQAAMAIYDLTTAKWRLFKQN